MSRVNVVLAHGRRLASLATAMIVSTALCCAAQATGRKAPAPWVTFLEGTDLAASIDTSRVVKDSSGTQVSLRFDYAHRQPPLQNMTTPYHRLDIREEVDCEKQRVRDVTMQLVDTSGRRHDGTASVQRYWQPFTTHPLTANLFNLLCSVLDSLRPAGHVQRR